MTDPLSAAISGALIALFEVWARHHGKPEGWKPSAQDIADILADVDASTPEAMKAEARKRLGITETMG